MSSESSCSNHVLNSDKVEAFYLMTYPNRQPRRGGLGGTNTINQGDNAPILIDNRSQSLALTASLKAAQVASDLQFLQSTCNTIVTRILIQQALQHFNAGNSTNANWETSSGDVQAALSSGGYAALFQAIIFHKSSVGNVHGLLNVTSSAVSPIMLPYKYSNGTLSCIIVIGCVKVAYANASSRMSSR